MRASPEGAYVRWATGSLGTVPTNGRIKDLGTQAFPFPGHCLCPGFQVSCFLSLVPRFCPFDCIGTQMQQKKPYCRLLPNLMDGPLSWALGEAHLNCCSLMRVWNPDVLPHSANA